MATNPPNPGSAAGVPVAPGFDARFIAELGAEAKGAKIINLEMDRLGDWGLPDAIPLLWDPKSGSISGLKSHIEAYRQYPRNKVGTAVVLTMGSFIALTNRHKTEWSAIFANTDWTKPSFTAVIDYHPIKPTEPDSIIPFPALNGKHRVRYDFPLSEEWQAWVRNDGEPMSQFDFAVFLEDRIPELCAPTDAEKTALERDFSTTIAAPAKLVELSRGLKVHVSSQVADERTLQTGEGQIQWAEVHKDEGGKPLKVPGIFLLSVAPFQSGDKVRIPVRLRYRVSGSKVTWFYQLYRPDLHITARVESDLARVAEETGLPTYEGAPEMAGA